MYILDSDPNATYKNKILKKSTSQLKNFDIVSLPCTMVNEFEHHHNIF